ncbi:MAG: STAS domain-containing protein [Actinomycetota bacterium]|nr:STAS domain-containing protein [Actinomycetota bacterium]
MSTTTGDDSNLHVEIAPDGVVVVRGDIDIAGGPVLDAALTSAEPAGGVVIDLEGVAFIDSSGLRCLLSAARRAAALQSAVSLRSVGPEVARLLQITGTTDQFVIESTRA